MNPVFTCDAPLCDAREQRQRGESIHFLGDEVDNSKSELIPPSASALVHRGGGSRRGFQAVIKGAWAAKPIVSPSLSRQNFSTHLIFPHLPVKYFSCMMLKLWKWYQKCLAVHPVKTQIISSGFLWGVGDVAAQTITHSTITKSRQNPDAVEEFKINWKRVAITSMFGFGFVGPVGHFWYEGLDRLIRLRLQLQPKSLRFVATKVAVDGIIFGPLDLFVFFTYMGFSNGKSVSQVKEDVKRDFLPALILEGGVWPVVQVVNFRFIPVRYQLLYVNTFCLLDSAFLSWIEQQEDAPWKQWFTSFLALEERES